MTREKNNPMSIKRDPKWKQDTPRMQLAALLQSVEAIIYNQVPRVASVPRTVDFEASHRALTLLKDAQKILEGMPDGEWVDGKEAPEPEAMYVLINEQDGSSGMFEGNLEQFEDTFGGMGDDKQDAAGFISTVAHDLGYRAYKRIDQQFEFPPKTKI